MDLKFILKARLHLLTEEFNRQMDEARINGHKYKCDSCSYGLEKVYEEVEANAMQMKCRCGSDLKVIDENELLEDEQRKVREALQNRMLALRKFDNYVVPANFFGVGHLSAFNPNNS